MHTHQLTVEHHCNINALLDGVQVSSVTVHPSPHDDVERWYVPFTWDNQLSNRDLGVFGVLNDGGFNDMLDRCHWHHVDDTVRAVCVVAPCPHDRASN